MPRALLPLLLSVAGCSTPPSASILRTSSAAGQDPERIVAWYNGEPLRWIEVAEKITELNPREAVEKYVAWRAVHDEKRALGVSHTSDELRKRADLAVRQIRARLGEEKFAEHLVSTRKTAEEYAADLAQRRNLADTLAVEKLTVYRCFAEGAVDAIWAAFGEEEEANAFLAALSREPDFERAYATLPSPGPKTRRHKTRTGLFPRSLAPPQLDDWILERLFALKRGETSGVEHSFQTGMIYVLHVADRIDPREGSYSALAGDVLRHLLEHPPSEELLRRLVEGYVRRSRIEYEHRSPQGD